LMRHHTYPPLYNASQQISSLNAKLSDLLLRMTKESENTKKALEKGDGEEDDDDDDGRDDG